MRSRRAYKKAFTPRNWRRLNISAEDIKKSSEELKRSNLVACIDTSVIDSIRLHTQSSRSEAISKVLSTILSASQHNGVVGCKIIGTPVVYSITFVHVERNKVRAEVSLRTKIITASVETLSSAIADAALQKAIDSTD